MSLMSELHVRWHCKNGHLGELVENFSPTCLPCCLCRTIWLYYQDLQIDGVIAFLEVRHGAVVGGKAVLVVFRLEWFHQDDVAVDVKCQHYVVVSAAGANWESAHVICVELADGLHLDK